MFLEDIILDKNTNDNLENHLIDNIYGVNTIELMFSLE